MDNLLHQVFYGKCYLCEEYANPICETCFDKLIPIKSPFKMSGTKKIISFYEYTDISRRILQISKYPPYEFFLLNYLSRLTFKKNRENLLNFLNPDNSLIFCPVPLNSLKLFERKFNQAEEISLCLSEVLRLPTFEILTRKKFTKPLFDLNKDERRVELSGAFKTNFLSYLVKICGCKRVVLVDDLKTTSQTLENCEKALRNLGFEEVHFLTLFAKK